MKIPHIQFSPKTHKDLGIEVVELSDIYTRLNNSAHQQAITPHRTTFYILLYITEGSGIHFIDFNTYSIQAGNTVFIHPNQIHAFDVKNSMQGKLIIFTESFINAIFATTKTPLFTSNYLLKTDTPTNALTHDVRNTCDNLLTEINKEYQLTTPNLSFLNLLFSALLTKLTETHFQHYQHHLSDAHTKTFTQFLYLLEQDYTEVHHANTYAKKLNITYKSLNHICKLVTQQTAKQLIDAHIILEAKRRLSIENIKVQQLTYALGFDDLKSTHY